MNSFVYRHPPPRSPVRARRRISHGYPRTDATRCKATRGDARRRGARSGPDHEGSVPAAGAECLAGLVDSQAAHAVGVLLDLVHGCVADAERVPGVAVVVVVAGEEQAARGREGDRGDATQDLVILELVELRVAAHVEQTAGAVVAARAEAAAVGEEVHEVDVAVVAPEGLHGAARAHVPDLGGVVEGACEDLVAVRVEVQGDDLRRVALQGADLLTRLNIPELGGVVHTACGDVRAL
mmetsp:Transcript_100683/g.280479  ORF Transcript_100683/g.280479 Transcript_100683/m.280479 type:complete len:238 (-) Transcript_100683:649-1362(-)